MDWLAADVRLATIDGKEGEDDGVLQRALGCRIDGAVSCVGAIEPDKDFGSFFGLSFDGDAMREDISSVNERIINLSKNAGAKRFSFLSVSYETQKALEGAIEGYIDGKRSVETNAYTAFGPSATAIGPSLVYGGKRFPTIGKVYRALVGGPGKLYVAGNDALRNISPAPLEDWVEKMLFSEPVEVEILARAVVVGVLMGGSLFSEEEGSEVVSVLEPRRQDFYSNEGESVTMVNIPFVDGTAEIERIAELMGTPSKLSDAIKQLQENDVAEVTTDMDAACVTARDALRTTERRVKDAAFEGALVGKKPYLYPLPVLLTFVYIFWGVATQQFTQVVDPTIIV